MNHEEQPRIIPAKTAAARSSPAPESDAPGPVAAGRFPPPLAALRAAVDGSKSGERRASNAELGRPRPASIASGGSRFLERPAQTRRDEPVVHDPARMSALDIGMSIAAVLLGTLFFIIAEAGVLFWVLGTALLVLGPLNLLLSLALIDPPRSPAAHGSLATLKAVVFLLLSPALAIGFPLVMLTTALSRVLARSR
jgi:hypothetical protein